MKNRKAPVFLFGVVVTALAAVTVWNASLRPMDARIESMNKDRESVQEQAVSDKDKESTRQAVLGALPTKAATGTRGPDGKLKAVVTEEAPGSSMEQAKEPTILLDSYEAYKPKPNDSTTMTHWYDDESRASKIAEENAKSKN